MAREELGRLNGSLFDLVDSFPRATWELVDYHYKSAYEEYLSALQRPSERRVAVFASSLAELERACRRLLLVSDTIVFNVATYSESPFVSIFPIPDSVKSPVLGVATVIDAESGGPRFPKPVEIAYMLTTTAALAESRGPDTVLGYEWGKQSVWQRSEFTRTSEPYRNDRGDSCHIAVGLGYRYEDETYSWLLTQARELMIRGSIVFAPFVRVTPDVDKVDEGLMKSHLVGAALATSGDKARIARGDLHPIFTLAVPYIDNVPLSLLGEVLADEEESLQAFRRTMDRAVEDIEAAGDPVFAQSELRRLKRELFEDELERLQVTCRRIARMRTLSAAGAVVTTGAISLAAAFGMAVPEVIMGAAGGLTTTLAELWHTFEETREIRRSRVHWLWKLGRSENAA